MTRSLSRGQAIVLGLVVVTGIVLGGIGLFAAGSRQWVSDAFRVRASFRDAGGVEVGARVQVQGVDAGEVEAIELPQRPGGDVVLHLSIAGKFRHLIRADSQVRITGENLLAGKIIRILPGTSKAPVIEENALLAGANGGDLNDNLTQTAHKLNAVLDDVAGTLVEFQRGEGTLGKLLNDAELYLAVMRSMEDLQATLISFKQNADAIKSLPLVSSYVVDVNKELNRPDCRRMRKYFAEEELFEPGKAVLTASGKKKLAVAAKWLNDHKEDGSEVVIAAFTDSNQPREFARQLSQKQSEAVADYLKSQHQIHSTGWWWWSTRRVLALGCGNSPTPVPESEALPPGRIELIVFVPVK